MASKKVSQKNAKSSSPEVNVNVTQKGVKISAQENLPKETPSKKKSKASRNFVIAMSLVSIVGFISIMLKSLFNINADAYIGTAWLITLGLGLVLETSFQKVKNVKHEGLTPEILGELTMFIVGSIAVIAGVLSLPQIGIQNASFLAVKGIISILGIIFIILQTWVTEEE